MFELLVITFFVEKKVTKKATEKQYTACFSEPP
jgi:hypothetical protein